LVSSVPMALGARLDILAGGLEAIHRGARKARGAMRKLFSPAGLGRSLATAGGFAAAAVGIVSLFDVLNTVEIINDAAADVEEFTLAIEKMQAILDGTVKYADKSVNPIAR